MRSAVSCFTTSSRCVPNPQNDASKKVRGRAPVPPQSAGSSAPLSSEATSTRKTLMAPRMMSNGGVARRWSTKPWQCSWYAPISPSV